MDGRSRFSHVLVVDAAGERLHGRHPHRRQARRPRRGASGAAAATAKPAAGRAEGPDRLHRAGPGTQGADGKRRSTARRFRSRPSGSAARATNFAAAVADFATATGIKVQVDSIGSSHETVLKTRIEGGEPPDLAMLAQPTPVLAYAAAGKVIDVATFMDAKKLSTSMPNTIGLVTQDDKIWGIPYKADVKSTIWYPIKAFEAKGYKVPTTWDELIALSDKIVADGIQPLVRQRRWPGRRDRLAAHRLGRGSRPQDQGPRLLQPVDQPQGHVPGPGHQGRVRQVRRQDLLHPEVRLRRQHGDRATGPEDRDGSDVHRRTAEPEVLDAEDPDLVRAGLLPGSAGQPAPSKYGIGTDVGIFAFPTIDPAQTYAEGSADTLMVLVDRPEVRAVAEYLATPEGIQNWIRAGSAISTNNTTPADWYAGSYKLKVAAEIASKAKGIGFDASDLMPGKVGAGTFWTKMDDWVNQGGTNTDATLKAIDDSWPAS